MDTNTAFKLAYNGNRGTNFMTPDFLRQGRIGKGLHYELSSGRGIEGQPIFGVTIVQEKKHTAKRRDDLSDVFESRAEAEQHIQSI